MRSDTGFGAEQMPWVEPPDDSLMQDAIHNALTKETGMTTERTTFYDGPREREEIDAEPVEGLSEAEADFEALVELLAGVARYGDNTITVNGVHGLSPNDVQALADNDPHTTIAIKQRPPSEVGEDARFYMIATWKHGRCTVYVYSTDLRAW